MEIVYKWLNESRRRRYMKKTFSVILVVFMLAVSTFALVACGGKVTADDWYNALNEYKTADALTLTINDDVRIGLLQNHVKSKITITFDAKAGTASVITSSTQNDWSGVNWSYGWTHEYYYVLDGTNVIEYYRYVTEYSDDWDHRKTREFDTAELAIEYMRDLYLNPCNTEKVEFPSFLELKYYDSNMTSTSNPREVKVNTFKTKFTQIYIEENSDVKRTFELSFSNSKLSKYHFEYDGGGLSEKRKTTIKISYSSSLKLPDNLPTEDFHQ